MLETPEQDFSHTFTGSSMCLCEQVHKYRLDPVSLLWWNTVENRHITVLSEDTNFNYSCLISTIPKQKFPHLSQLEYGLSGNSNDHSELF